MPAPHRPLPISLEEITRDWLTAALRTRHPGVTVRALEIVDVLRGTCTKIRLKLDLDDAGRRAGIPEQVILKGGFEAHARELSQMHEREVRGYRDVFPVLALPTPACHFADYDPERKQGIIIMDDLAARGVTFCNALRPQTYEQVARRLGVLARFHARSWDSPELAPGGRWGDLPEFFAVMRGFFERNVSREAWQRFIGAPRGAAVSVRFHDRDWMADAWDRLTRFSQRLPHCVLHGDIHLGNLYIEADGTPGFLDTLASRGPGMLEVSYHVSASVDAADRPRWEGALVQHYLDELASSGVDAPAFDDAMHQYGILPLYGYFIWITTESHYQPEAVNTANAARVSAAMLDHDTRGLLESIGAA
jgi:aminoglycoside/choline kinase family phosphotransferase